MNHPLRSIAKAGIAAVALGMCGAGTIGAQAPAVLPIPFANTIGGLAAGSGNTACGSTIPTGSPSGTNMTGDGCPATQATLNDPYGVFVDGYGNIYFGDYNNYAVRVIYMGGANLAAALQAANPNLTTAPKVGYMYTLAGGRSSALSDVTPPGGGTKGYFCNGVSAVGGTGLNNKGDNCPATYAYLKPRNPYVDAYGNVLFTTASGAALRVVYVGGAQMAALIQTLDGVAPQVGYSYSIISSSSNGYAGDGGLANTSTTHVFQERDVAMDSQGNIYMSDGEVTFTAPNYESNNNIRVVNATTGIISTFAGSPQTGTYACPESTTATSGCAGAYSGDGGPATAATLDSPYTIFFDRYDNLYITDWNDDRVRVVYKQGSVPGLGSNLTPGNIYTVVGGGALTASGTPATSLSLGVVNSGGIDATGNLYVVDGTKNVIWRVDANTGIAVIIAGGRAATTKGAFCNGGATGPVATDNYGDGCPGLQSSVLPGGKVAFDRLGNFYEADSSSNVIRKFSYNTVYPATAVGSNVTQPLALVSPAGATLNGETITLEGATTSEFSDAGITVDTCTSSSVMLAGGVCVFGITFTPSASGLRTGDVRISSTAGSVANYAVGGDGLAANTSVDPASVTDLGFTQTTTITGYSITNEVVTFNAVNSLIAGQLVTISGFPTSTFLNGQTFTVQAQGLSSTQFSAAFIYANVSQTTESGKGTYYGGLTPTGVYADSLGNIFAADGGGSRLVKMVAASPGTTTVLMTGLSKPSQVAVDGTGNVYVADAGNNRIAMTGPGGGTVTSLGTGLNAPQGVAVDVAGNVYVADTGNNRVMELPAGGGQTIVNITGLSKPTAIAVDGADDLFVLDSGNDRIVKLPLNFEQSVVNLGTTAITPTGIAVDAAGDLYLSDSSSDSVVEFAPGSVNGNALVTGLISPLGVAVDLNGSLYVADSSQTSILAANRGRPVTPFPDTNINTSNTAPLNVTNTGNATLAFNGATTTTATGNTAVFAVTPASSGGCTTSTTLASGSACGLVATVYAHGRRTRITRRRSRW